MHDTLINRSDTVGQPCQGEDVAPVLVGQSLGRNQLVCSLRAVRDATQNFLSEKSALRRVSRDRGPC
jgi:hypothetical protein